MSDQNIGLPSQGIERLEKRYLWRDSNGKLVETPLGMVKRVTKFMAGPEKSPELRKKWQKEFEAVMVNHEFWPGTMVLANAGKPKAQLGNCYVLPIEDSIEGIFQALFDSSVIKKNGGGFGSNFSCIRPKGDSVANHPGLAAGPIKLMKLFDDASGIYIAPGRYMGGNMVVLDTHHPDILEFISCKETDGTFPLTNISIGVTDKFMEAVAKNKKWDLINPRSQEVVNSVPARTVLDLAAHYAHKTGDPGLMFYDNINKKNPMLKGLGPIECTNLCGELPLYPYEACNLGYFNLVSFLLPEDKRKAGKYFDYSRLRKVAEVAVRFMDNTVEAASFPIEKINGTVKSLRRLGIGVCGWADCLAELEIPYDDTKAFALGEEIMKEISTACHEASVKLGKEKGPFAWVDKSSWANKADKPRNVATNTLPPSSCNAPILGVSFSIEPYFGLAYEHNILDGDTVHMVNPVLINKLSKHGIRTNGLIKQILENNGSVQGMRKVPASLREVFKTTYDLGYRAHIKMQASFQKHTDNSISKTINMPYDATQSEVKDAYMLAWKLGCKGITVYRQGSKEGDVFQYSPGSKDRDRSGAK